MIEEVRKGVLEWQRKHQNRGRTMIEEARV